METIYYHLDAQRVSVCDRASGETAPVARRYTCLRKAPAVGGAPAQVLDFAAYRRKLAPDAYPEAPAEAERAPVAAPRSRPRPKAWLVLIPDLCATLAVVVMAFVVVSRFLPLL